jgi:hypothetical protein
LVALLSTNAYSDTVLSEWDAFPQSVEALSEMGNLGHLPVRVVTALHTYYEQSLPGQSPDETTRIWQTLQNDLLHLSTNSKQTILEEATHFSLLINPRHARFVSDIILELVKEEQ